MAVPKIFRKKFEAGHRAHFVLSRSRLFLAFSMPSLKPTAFARDSASVYFFLASSARPSISANSPRLCVATAHPMSHSSVRSSGLTAVPTSIAFSAQERAFEIRTARDVGGPTEELGRVWARDVERLFIKTAAWQDGGDNVTARR